MAHHEHLGATMGQVAIEQPRRGVRPLAFRMVPCNLPGEHPRTTGSTERSAGCHLLLCQRLTCWFAVWARELPPIP